MSEDPQMVAAGHIIDLVAKLGNAEGRGGEWWFEVLGYAVGSLARASADPMRHLRITEAHALTVINLRLMVHAAGHA